MSATAHDRSRTTAEQPVIWMRARGTNVLRRPLRVGAVGTAAFVAALITLVLIPRDANRQARLLAPRADERPDTAAMFGEIRARTLLLARADSVLDATLTRARAPRPVAPALTPEAAARRDSLASALASLDQAITRAENAPLSSSYRTLATMPELQADAEARTLLDSLTTIEREREALSAEGGVNPAFVGLTSRVVAIGQAIQRIAERRREAVRASLVELQEAATAARAPVPEVDTLSPRLAREDAAAMLAAAAARLDSARRLNAALDRRAAQARELANIHAPPLARLAAALVIGLAIGFATTLASELRRPRVADAREAERVAGVRVISVVGPVVRPPDRARRRSDRDVPRLIDRSAEHYRLLYLHLTAAGSPLSFVTLTGDEPAVTAIVAANLAAASAGDARATLLVDADPAASNVAGVLHLAPIPGLTDIIAGRTSWAEVITSAVVGRDQLLDVIPSGARLRRTPDAGHDSALAVRRDLARLARRYDLVVLVSPLDDAKQASRSFLPAPDLVVCVRAGHTTLRDLATHVQALRHAGTRVRGIVLWADHAPSITPRPELDEGFEMLPPAIRRAGTGRGTAGIG